MTTLNVRRGCGHTIFPFHHKKDIHVPIWIKHPKPDQNQTNGSNSKVMHRAVAGLQLHGVAFS